MDKGMKKRWISLYVENQVGVLSKISGLFSGKSYNLDSLTVGTTEDPTVSRMTIATKAIQTVLPKQYQTKDKPPLIGKDYNDFLCSRLGLQRTIREKKGQEKGRER